MKAWFSTLLVFLVIISSLSSPVLPVWGLPSTPQVQSKVMESGTSELYFGSSISLPSQSDASELTNPSPNKVDTGTYWCGDIITDTTWYAANSPYIVTCDMTILATLFIENDTEVKFYTGKELNVLGKLHPSYGGDVNGAIPLFRAYGSTWAGIDVLPGGEVDGAVAIQDAQTGLYFYPGSVNSMGIADLEYNETGLETFAAEVDTINILIIRHNNTGIKAVSVSQWDPGFVVASDNQYAIRVVSGSMDLDLFLITGNTYGIYLENDTGSKIRGYFRDNTWAVYNATGNDCVDAIDCQWGDRNGTGPYDGSSASDLCGLGANYGDGDPVSNNVRYVPWLWSPCNTPGQAISCGESQNGNNGGDNSHDTIDRYSCSSWDETGPEYTYRLVPTVSGGITVTLSNLSADLDIFVIDGSENCNARNCIAYGNNTVTFEAVAGQTYYLVVDGYQGAIGDYTISVDCPGLSVADLQVSDLSSTPTTPVAFEPSSLTLELTNIGDARYEPGDGNYELTVVFTDTGFSPSTIKFGFDTEVAQSLPRLEPDSLDALEPGESTLVVVSDLRFPADAQGQIGVRLIPKNNDPNLSNNSYTATLSVAETPHGWIYCIGALVKSAFLVLAPQPELALSTVGLLDVERDILLLCNGNTTCIVNELGDFFGVGLVDILIAHLLPSEIIELVLDIVEMTFLLLEDWAPCLSWVIDVISDLIADLNTHGMEVNAAIAASPIYIRVTDSEGKQAGFLDDGTIIQEIEGSEVVSRNGAKIVLYPGDHTSSVRIKGTSDGNFDLSLALAAEGSTAAKVLYLDVPVTPMTIGTIDAYDESFLMSIDEDGDGIVDWTKAPNSIDIVSPMVYLPLVVRDFR